MKKIILTGLIVLTTFFFNAQGPVFQWAKTISGTINDRGKSIAADPAGNVYTMGNFGGTADFDPSASVFTVTSAGSGDIFISKLNSAGNFAWAKTIGGGGNDAANDMFVDASGNVYTAGFFSGTWDFDPSAAVFNLTAAGSDIYIFKLDANGNFVWAKNIGTAGNAASVESITLDASGNIYITGSFLGTVDFDPSVSVFNLTSAGSNEVYVEKLDATGNFVWARSMGGAGMDIAYGITVDASGNVYTIGNYNAVGDFDPGAAVFNMTPIGGYDIFVSKLNAAGNFVWAKSLGGTATDGSKGIALDASGNVYATGYYAGTPDFDPSASVFNLASNGSNDAFICKLDNSGNFVWAKNLGGPNSDVANGISVEPATGNVYTVGTYIGIADFDPGVGTFTLSGSGEEIFISKLDANGNYVWAVDFGSGGIDNGNSIFLDASNNVYTTGSFEGNPDFDTSPAILYISSGGFGDVFTHKLSPCLTPAAPTNTTLAANLNICANKSGTLAAISSGTITWYSTATSTTVLQTGTVYITPTLTAGTYTYYAEAATCTISATRTPITFTVNALPTVSVTSGVICAGQSFTMIPSGANTYTFSNGNAVVSPITTTSYSLTGTSLLGCKSSNTAVATVTVNPKPLISVNSGSICSGNSFTIIPNGASTYTIAGGSSIVSPLTNTTYTVAGTSSLGCISSNTPVSSVTVNTTPTVSVNSGAICMGKNFTITSTGANTYTISGGLSIVSPTINTTYSITGTSTAGCISSNTAVSSVTVNATPTISVNSGVICKGQSYTINPAGASTYTISGGVSIVSPTITSNYTVTGTNLSGCTASIVASVSVNATPSISVNSGSICNGSSFTISPSGASTYTISGGVSIVSPTINTTYSVTGTSSLGCISSNTAISSVSINPGPTVGVNSGVICAGNNFTITPTGASTYTISGGNAIVTPTGNVSYSITGTNLSGCVSSNTAISSVTVNVLPIVLAVTGNSLICIGQNASLTASGANTYSWNTTATNSVIVVSPTVTTGYTVTGTDASGCKNIALITQSVSTCTGIEMLTTLNSPAIILYPNPTNGNITVELNNESGKAIEVIDITGRVVLNVFSSENKVKVNINDLSNGIYYVKVTNDNVINIIKIIKQ
ncbi:MAG: T9SS type A sorting domain-containing protein [Bacteroidetes bacterium]|nr:T9SS type A sorting domain-containing protein [Bacteroidota bacterium]